MTKGLTYLAIVTWLITTTSLADFKTDLLVEVLKTSTQSHLRARAARALGRVEPTVTTIQALANTLSDKDSEVVASSTKTLINIGEETLQVPGLYYLNIGVPTSLVDLSGSNVNFNRIHTRITQQLAQLPGALLVPSDGVPPIPLLTVLPRYEVNVSVVHIEWRTDGAVNIQVIISINQHLTGKVRALVSGGVWVTGDDPDKVNKAIRLASLVAADRIEPAMKSLSSR